MLVWSVEQQARAGGSNLPGDVSSCVEGPRPLHGEVTAQMFLLLVFPSCFLWWEMDKSKEVKGKGYAR